MAMKKKRLMCLASLGKVDGTEELFSSLIAAVVGAERNTEKHEFNHESKNLGVSAH